MWLDRKLLAPLAVGVAFLVVLSGCAGGGSAKNGKGKNAYVPEFRQFELYLYPLRTTDGTGGWTLYPGANVDAWAFTDEAGNPASAAIPGPTIRVREGDTVQISLIFATGTMAHTIHWHGLHVPWDMDGVPYVSQMPLGATAQGGNGSNGFVYTFAVHQSGTYWYHCHVDTAHHLDMGMYGAFIVDPADPDQDPKYDQEQTLILDEWDRSHAHSNEKAYQNALSKSGDPMTSANDFYSYVRDYLFMSGYYESVVRNPNLDNLPGMRENRTWYPVTYAPYFATYDTFLINGKAFPATEPIFVKTGETLRLRFINAGEQVHAMHIHGHHFLVTHKDGYLLPAPYYADTILIGPGERYDAYIKADNPGPWHLHDHIALNEQNDYISPGGMATMLCYTDGWPNAAECGKGHTMITHGQSYTNAELLKSQTAFLKQREVLQNLRNQAGAGSSTPTASVPVVSGIPIPSVPAHSH